MEQLLEHRASTNQCTSSTGAPTPLHIAAQEGQTTAVRLLLNARAQVDRLTTDQGASALHMACQNGHAHAAALLLRCRAQLHRPLTAGPSPLLLASQGEHVLTMAVLVRAKANPRTVQCANWQGQGPLSQLLARAHWSEHLHSTLESRFREQSVAWLLTSRGTGAAGHRLGVDLSRQVVAAAWDVRWAQHVQAQVASCNPGAGDANEGRNGGAPPAGVLFGML